MSLPTIANLELDSGAAETELSSVHASMDWDFETGDFKLANGSVREISGIDYLKVWIKKAVLTHKGALIYANREYGSGHHDMIGRNLPIDFLRMEYERALQEALLQNDAILSVSNFVFAQEGARLFVSFDVMSIYGQTDMAVMME